MKRVLLSIVLVLGLGVAGNAFSQTLCVKVRTADLRSSPSFTGSVVLLQVPRHYPLIVQAENGDFLRVSDFLGREGWIAKSLLGEQEGVVVNARVANVRSGPGEDHAVLFKARQGVTFRVLEVGSDWLRVKHESGKQGWIYKSLVWGLESQV